MFTNAQLKALLLPLLLEQFLSVSMGLADTVMVSGVGEAAVSSVSLVDSLNVLIIQILSALATGGAVVASQYLGRKDEKNAQLSAAPAVFRSHHADGFLRTALHSLMPPDLTDRVWFY